MYPKNSQYKFFPSMNHHLNRGLQFLFDIVVNRAMPNQNEPRLTTQDMVNIQRLIYNPNWTILVFRFVNDLESKVYFSKLIKMAFWGLIGSFEIKSIWDLAMDRKIWVIFVNAFSVFLKGCENIQVQCHLAF